MRVSSYFITWVMFLNFISVNVYATEDGLTNIVTHCIPGVTCAATATDDELKQNISCLEPKDDDSLRTEPEITKCLKDARSIQMEIENDRIEANATGRIIDRAALQAKYNMADMVDKAPSDFKSCTFNSFNDQYRSASNSERMAEITLRAFEYLYSGAGTIDYWLDSNGISLFERVKVIAKDVRKYRTKVIKKYEQIDEEMKCKCIASFGINKFPEEQGFFSSKCGTFAAGYSTEVLAEGEVAKTTGDASGIAQEKLLLAYLALRKEAQFNKFEEFSKIATKIDEIVEYINDLKWEQSWEKQDYLYTMNALRFDDGYITASTILDPVGFNIFVSTVYKPRLKELEDLLDNKEMMKMFGDKNGFTKILSPPMMDWPTTTGSGGDFDNNIRDYKRYYVGPYFDNINENIMTASISASLPAEKKCQVYAFSRACVKNIHTVTYNNETRYLLDAKFPEFVADTDYTKNSNYVKMINDAHANAIVALANTKPSAKLNYMRKNHKKYFDINWASFANSFQPMNGGWSPTAFPGQQKVIAAAKKYAACTHLKKCGASHLGDDEQDAYGFGYYLTDANDQAAFAKYFYEQHFLLPSLSAFTQMGYPTMAQVGYLENISYSLNVLALASADRGLNLGDTYDNYKSDWDSRIGDYQLNKGMKDGMKSVNPEYSKEFRTEFKRLNFTVGTNIGEIYDKNGKVKNSKSFSSSELNSIEYAAKNAIKNKKILKGKIDPKASAAEKIYLKAQLDRQKNLKLANSQSSGSHSRRRGFKSSKTPKMTGIGSKTSTKKIAAFHYNERERRKRTKLKLKKRKKKKKSSSSIFGVNRSAIKHSQDALNLFESIDRHSKELSPVDTDSLFQVVTKAYKRNLFRIFKQKKIVGEGLNDIKFNKSKSLNDRKKEELKSLLGD